MSDCKDVEAFGADAWVYCSAHRRPHETGWCSVSPREKVGLGVKTAKQALEKCRAWGFSLACDDPPLASYTPEELVHLIRPD